MAHIPDGILSLPVLAGGGLAAAGGVGLGLRALDERDIPKTAILAAGFFVASLLAVPIGPSSVHPLLGGLMGLVLGIRVFPAVFVGLLLQAVLFGFGGLSTLGVDTVTMALPGLVFATLARPLLARAGPTQRTWIAGGVAVLAVFGTAGGVALALALSASEYVPALSVVLLTYGPLAVVEGGITAATVAFLGRVKPDILPFLTPVVR
jgi:cobalt/nickel transport system permease protein